MRLISPSFLLTIPITLSVTAVLASSSSKTPTGTTTADANPNAKSGNVPPNANAAANSADGAPGNASGGGIEVPNLGTIIQRANTLLTTGQFNDAARTYSEALELSPNDYVLYYKRATAYLSSNRHSPALDDFDKVLQLTDGTFDGAVIAKAKIYTKEGRWEESREALATYSKRVTGDKTAQDLVSFVVLLVAQNKTRCTRP
jgi:DnaJ family protein C protein 3